MDDISKKEHEEFVSGLKGSSAVEVMLLTFIPVISSQITTLTDIRYFIKSNNESSNFWLGTFLEILALVSPMILSLTVLSDYVGTIVISLLLVLCLLKCFASTNQAENSNEKISSHIEAFTQFRGHLLLVTALSILAVDFSIFPRRFAKTETFGWGFMDIGVGSFVMATGLVSQESRREVKSRMDNFKYSLTSSAPLLLLGLLRTLVTSMVNYQEHISEYGSHWNFFFSLAITKVLATCLLSIIPVNSAAILSFLVIGIYQICLSSFGLADFIESNYRRNIFEANKEGIFSLTGYVAIYLHSVAIGRAMIKYRNVAPAITWTLLMSYAMITYLLMNSTHYNIQNTSRRFCNLSYFLWIVSMGCFHLAVYTLSKEVIPEKSRIIESINRYGTLYFLAANLLTGLINLTIDTIHASTLTALYLTYIFISSLTLMVCFLNKRSRLLKV